MSSAVPSENPGPFRAHRWRVFGVAWLLLSLLSAGWSVATPISASPDEPAHMVKAASVVRGQFIGVPSTLGHIVQVPRYVADTHARTCFAFLPQVTADCAEEDAASPGDIVDSTTTAGLYNPVYYLMVGWPTLVLQTDAGIYAMRILSGVVTALFLALGVMLAYGWRRNALPLLALATATPPMLLFLAGSVNPNALEATATLAVFMGMLSITAFPDRRLLTERTMIVLAGAALAVNTRGLSPLWVAIAVLAPLLLLRWPRLRELFTRPAVLWAAGGAILSTVFAGAWLMGSSSLTAAMNDTDSFQQFPGVGASALAGFITTLWDTFGYGQGMIGNFGWLDTPAPLGVYSLWSVLTGIILLAAFTVLRRRSLALAATLLAAFLLLPALIQSAYITDGGIIWQGRYSLALYGMLIVGLGALVANHIDRLPRRQTLRFTVIVWLLWAAAQFMSFATALRRYAAGADGTWRTTLFTPEWSAPGGNVFCLVVFALTLAAVVAGAALLTARSLDDQTGWTRSRMMSVLPWLAKRS